MTKLLTFILALMAAGLCQALAGPATTPPPSRASTPASSIAPGCNLQGADLTNTCVKAKNLTGADFDGAKAVLMCMSFANFSNATFRGTRPFGRKLGACHARWRPT